MSVEIICQDSFYFGDYYCNNAVNENSGNIDRALVDCSLRFKFYEY